MGDTGALALGSSLAVVALMTGQWLLLPIIGIVFVAEAASNILQIGWAETQIVTRAWLIAIAAAMLGVALALAVPE
jgi:phospho-N-acetylmuramoyl-pentapeptide-transferase